MSIMNNNINALDKKGMPESHWYTACWNYFSLLSGQRMQMLQFFISLEVFLSGAFITLISLTTRLHWAEVTVSALVFLMAIVFMGLDHRTKTMIHECEKSMTEIEKADPGNTTYNPITCVNNNLTSFFTYTKLIRFLQATFAIAGRTSAILVLCNVI